MYSEPVPPPQQYVDRSTLMRVAQFAGGSGVDSKSNTDEKHSKGSVIYYDGDQ